MDIHRLLTVLGLHEPYGLLLLRLVRLLKRLTPRRLREAIEFELSLALSLLPLVQSIERTAMNMATLYGRFNSLKPSLTRQNDQSAVDESLSFQSRKLGS
jgi:hypothetical protein